MKDRLVSPEVGGAARVFETGRLANSPVTHSVERHLEVDPVAYDAAIVRFVPSYDEMLSEVVSALREALASDAPHVLDLGAGTGGLSSRVAEAFPRARLTMLDVDTEMLGQAVLRLAAHRDRVTPLHASFADELPRCDAAVASLSLHHVHDARDKVALYRRVREALSAGGVLASADAFMSQDADESRPLMKRWAAHLMANGHTEEQARDRFAQWAREDRFFAIDQELAMLREAGFASVDVRFRKGPVGVIVARR